MNYEGDGTAIFGTRQRRTCLLWLHCPLWAKAMKTMSAKEAKNAFGLLIDTARAEPVMIEKHGRGVVVVVAVEEYERLQEASRPDRLQKIETQDPTPRGQ